MGVLTVTLFLIQVPSPALHKDSHQDLLEGPMRMYGCRPARGKRHSARPVQCTGLANLFVVVVDAVVVASPSHLFSAFRQLNFLVRVLPRVFAFHSL